MDNGPWSQRRETSHKRVLSPNAAKTGTGEAEVLLRVLRKVLLDQRHHHCPSAFVVLECLSAALQRNLVKAGFCHRQLDAVLHILQLENNKRSRLQGVINSRIDCAWMPAKRQSPLRLNLNNRDL